MTFPFATSTIVAQAFGMVELSPPSSFADDTPQAQDAAQHYASSLDICLELNDWSFASRMVALSSAALPEGVIADPDLPFSFRLPGDCIALREVKTRAVRFRLDEMILRADQPGPLPIRYTRRITDLRRADRNRRGRDRRARGKGPDRPEGGRRAEDRLAAGGL